MDFNRMFLMAVCIFQSFTYVRSCSCPTITYPVCRRGKRPATLTRAGIGGCPGCRVVICVPIPTTQPPPPTAPPTPPPTTITPPPTKLTPPTTTPSPPTTTTPPPTTTTTTPPPPTTTTPKTTTIPLTTIPPTTTPPTTTTTTPTPPTTIPPTTTPPTTTPPTTATTTPTPTTPPTTTTPSSTTPRPITTTTKKSSNIEKTTTTTQKATSHTTSTFKTTLSTKPQSHKIETSTTPSIITNQTIVIKSKESTTPPGTTQPTTLKVVTSKSSSTTSLATKLTSTKLTSENSYPTPTTLKPEITTTSVPIAITKKTKTKKGCLIDKKEIKSGQKVVIGCTQLCSCSNGKLKRCKPLCPKRDKCLLNQVPRRFRKVIKKNPLCYCHVIKCTNDSEGTTLKPTSSTATSITKMLENEPTPSKTYIYIGIAIGLIIIVLIIACGVWKCYQISVFKEKPNTDERRRTSSWLRTRKLPAEPGKEQIFSVGNTFINHSEHSNLRGTPLVLNINRDRAQTKNGNVYEPSPPIEKRIRSNINTMTHTIQNSDATKLNLGIYQNTAHAPKEYLENYQIEHQYLEMTFRDQEGIYDCNTMEPLGPSSYSTLNEGFLNSVEEYQCLNKDNQYQSLKGYENLSSPSNRKKSYEILFPSHPLTPGYEDMNSGNRQEQQHRKLSSDQSTMNNMDTSCHYEVPPEIGSYHPELFGEMNNSENHYEVDSYLDLTDE